MNTQQHVIGQPWFRLIEERATHMLWHETDIASALAILQSGVITGASGLNENLESYPHFIYEGWSRGQNHLPVRSDVTLTFRCELPARYRGEGTMLPESGWLEVYSIGSKPWQCCLHPDNPPLTFAGALHWEPRLSRRAKLPFGASAEASLDREVTSAKRSGRSVRVEVI